MGKMPLKPVELCPLTPGLNLAHCLCQWQNNVFNKFPGRSYAAWKMHSFNMFICITDLSFGRVYYSLCKLIHFPASSEMHIRKGSQRLWELKRPSVCFSLQSPPTSFPEQKQFECWAEPFKNKSSGIDNIRYYSDTYLAFRSAVWSLALLLMQSLILKQSKRQEEELYF